MRPATRVGGIFEAVEDGQSGLLVEPHHPDALAGAISTLSENPGPETVDGSQSTADCWKQVHVVPQCSR
ncbi:MAG: glycosyltransferase, partial [bacterium]